MSSIWLEVRRALREDADKAHAASEGVVERRDGVDARGHVHDHLHDELRALRRIGGREPAPAYYPNEGSDPYRTPGADAGDRPRPRSAERKEAGA